MTTRDVLPEACHVISAVVGAAEVDPDAPTPCRDYDVLTLARHFVGTTGAFVHAGRDHALDADDPWGAKVRLAADDWPATLAANLDALPDAWGSDAAWSGSVPTGTMEMPAKTLGEMALIEVMLHGWDLATASGQSVEVSPALAGELLRCVAETAEMGREYGAYGPAVPVPGHASDLAQALGLAGRDPGWRV